MMHEVGIWKVDVQAHNVQQTRDYVAEEKPLFVFLGKTHYVTILCSPHDLKELALGHLLSEGIIKDRNEIARIDLEGEACHIRLVDGVNLSQRLKLSGPNARIIHSVCGSPTPYQYLKKISAVKSARKVKAQTIRRCVARLNSLAETFRKTGGVHVAAVYKRNGALVAYAEDVGRHNAVDKAIGKAALKDARFSDCFLALSGRMTGDIVRKAARLAVPVLASMAGAVDSGIRTAQETGLSLVGFVRGNRMNVYASPERILA